MRGENWPMASWTSTSVRVSTTLMSVTMEVAIMLRIVWAALGLPVRLCGIRAWSKERSMAVVTNARTMPPSTHSSGTTQRLVSR